MARTGPWAHVRGFAGGVDGLFTLPVLFGTGEREGEGLPDPGEVLEGVDEPTLREEGRRPLLAPPDGGDAARWGLGEGEACWKPMV